MKLLAQAHELLRHIISPPFCTHCRIILSERFPLCKACLALLQPVIATSLKLTDKHAMTVFALGAYEEPLALLVRAKQYRNHVAAHQLGVLLAQYVATLTIPIDCLVPLPLHWRRYAWRGYNQAALMAREIGQSLAVPVQPLLQRTRHTAFQMSLARPERKENVTNIFKIKEPFFAENMSIYAGKHLVLVDDVMTTGATLQAAGRELLRLKPASISALVAARVIGR